MVAVRRVFGHDDLHAGGEDEGADAQWYASSGAYAAMGVSRLRERGGVIRRGVDSDTHARSPCRYSRKRRAARSVSSCRSGEKKRYGSAPGHLWREKLATSREGALGAERGSISGACP